MINEYLLLVEQSRKLIGRDKISCTKCGTAFKWYKNFQYHVKFVCGKKPRFKCAYCPQTSKRRNDLKNHIRLKNPDQVVFVIELCE